MLDGWTAEDARRDGDGFVITLTSASREVRSISASIVVGAWGRWGRFDRLLGRSFARDRTHRHFGFKRHYRDRGSGRATDTIDLHSFASGYLGVNAVERDRTNICGLVHETRLSGNRGGWDSFVRKIRAERPALETLYASHEPAQEEFLSSEPVIFAPRSAVENGILLVGDAAGLIDPLAGNGMAMAVQSALIASSIVMLHLDGAITRGEMERRYREEHASFFLSRIRWSRMIAWLLSRPALVDALLSIGRALPMGGMLLAKTRANPRALAELIRKYESRQGRGAVRPTG